MLSKTSTYNYSPTVIHTEEVPCTWHLPLKYGCIDTTEICCPHFSFRSFLWIEHETNCALVSGLAAMTILGGQLKELIRSNAKKFIYLSCEKGRGSMCLFLVGYYFGVNFHK